MDDVMGYFMTWVTYGTWLPGDTRGWVEYRHGWQLPDPVRELEAAARMTEDACRLNAQQREAVQQQIAETCGRRGWHLHAVNCRSNHVHVVVSAGDTPPKKIRTDLKAWATRCLKQQARSLADASGYDAARSLAHASGYDADLLVCASGYNVDRENWWAERRSIRFLYDEVSLDAAILYATDGQEFPR
jgi:REP element-mobilizing transposase RayT